MKLAWSRLAKKDLFEVRQFSVERWGRDVAQRYLEDLRDAAKKLSAAPMRARVLKAPFRIFRVRSHYLIIYVDADSDCLTVARVIHVSMDIERHLFR